MNFMIEKKALRNNESLMWIYKLLVCDIYFKISQIL